MRVRKQRDTLVDTNSTPSRDTHSDGWLTAESYVAWIATQSGVINPERLTQPPVMEPTAEEDAEACVTSSDEEAAA